MVNHPNRSVPDKGFSLEALNMLLLSVAELQMKLKGALGAYEERQLQRDQLYDAIESAIDPLKNLNSAIVEMRESQERRKKSA